MRFTAMIGIAAGTAAAAASLASADGPQPGATVSTASSPDGRTMYVSSPMRRHRTRIRVWRAGERLRAVTLRGRLGFPIVSMDGASEGASRDGRTLVATSPSGRFVVLNAHPLRSRFAIELGKRFSYDALSPHARTLYLIQHVRAPFSNRYYVRAYDLKSRRLLKTPIFDTREKWSVMSGWPVTRATSASGRWV